MRLSDAHVRMVHRDITDPGPDPTKAHFTEADYDAHLAEFLAQRPDGPIEVFCYGSLIWRPSFAPARTARARALDWHRSFCLHMVRWRGTPEQPGLMMQIDRGGLCEGIVQQVPEADEMAVLRALWRREMTIKPPANYPRWIDVDMAEGSRRAIAFTANRSSANYTGRLDPEVVTQRIAWACGHLGSNAAYLFNTITALEGAGIHDPYLWDLQERVARLIEARFPEACPA